MRKMNIGWKNYYVGCSVDIAHRKSTGPAFDCMTMRVSTKASGGYTPHFFSGDVAEELVISRKATSVLERDLTASILVLPMNTVATSDS